MRKFILSLTIGAAIAMLAGCAEGPTYGYYDYGPYYGGPYYGGGVVVVARAGGGGGHFAHAR